MGLTSQRRLGGLVLTTGREEEEGCSKADPLFYLTCRAGIYWRLEVRCGWNFPVSSFGSLPPFVRADGPAIDLNGPSPFCAFAGSSRVR